MTALSKTNCWCSYESKTKTAEIFGVSRHTVSNVMIAFEKEGKTSL